MKTNYQKNTQSIPGTFSRGILVLKKLRDEDNKKAQFQILDTWLKHEVIFSYLPNSPDKKSQSVPVLQWQVATMPKQVSPLLNRRDRLA